MGANSWRNSMSNYKWVVIIHFGWNLRASTSAMGVSKAPELSHGSSDQGANIWSLHPLHPPYLQGSMCIRNPKYISRMVCEQSSGISWVYLHERWQWIRERIRAKKIRPTVQLEIIEATRATFKKIFLEKLATKKDHLIKQYINFWRIVFYRRHWFKKGSIGK